MPHVRHATECCGALGDSLHYHVDVVSAIPLGVDAHDVETDCAAPARPCRITLILNVLQPNPPPWCCAHVGVVESPPRVPVQELACRAAGLQHPGVGRPVQVKHGG
eukprot:scaffold78917_cov33-Tisochrysis_lutea.AAC.4